MLTVHQLGKSYGLQPILNNITFSVNPGQRVGLIGPNGSGKTTLLRLITGQERPNHGLVSFTPSTLRVGYLAQGFEPDADLTLPHLLHQTIGDPDLLEAELTRLALALAEEPNRPDLQDAYDATLQQLNRSDPGKIASVLAAFELDAIPADQPLGTLSGGQKTRLALSLLLLDDPQLLLLDEPTNHLDIAMLEWLEDWLAAFDGGVLLVSHDRAFLDRTATHILDLDPKTQTMRAYTGTYSDYMDQYLAEQEKQWAAYKEQVYEIRRMRQDIARTREQSMSVERSTKPNQPSVRRLAKKVMKKAKSREKKLERYLEAEERVEKPARSWQMKLEFEMTHLGQDVVRLQDLAVGYAGQPELLTGLHLDVAAGERIILTGPNGSGKTTLLRTIVGFLPPQNGRFQLGHSVQMGYMAQEQELLDPEATALQTIQQAAPLNETDTRSFLHYFLFTDEEPLKPIQQLSFGQRSRLTLALLVARGCNFLLLDEPINHLDIPSREQFEQALTQFEGTVLAVVHDRYFIQRFATQVWWVEKKGVRIEYLRV